MRVCILLFVSILVLAVPASSSITTPAPPVKAKGSDSLFRIQENGKWGYMDRYGIVVIEPLFDSAADFFKGLALASRDGVTGYIDAVGNWRIRIHQGVFGNFEDESALFTRVDDSNAPETGRGLIDRAGHSVISPQVDYLEPFSEGRTAVAEVSPTARVLNVIARGDKFGFIDESGDVAIPFQFDLAAGFSEGLASVAMLSERDASGGPRTLKWGFIDRQGNVAISLQFADVTPFAPGAAVYRDTVAAKAGLVDRTGKIILQAHYADIESHQTDTGSVGGLYKAWVGGKDYDFLRPDGSLAFQVDNASVDRFSEGLARISRERKFGFINASGTTIISMTFEDAGNFSEGVAAVKKERWGFVDKAGEWVIPPQFEGAMEFRGGLAFVRLGLTWHYIDKQGRMIRPTAWTYPPCAFSDPNLIDLRPLLCGY